MADEYDDDFEAYEEDFEEDTENDVKEVKEVKNEYKVADKIDDSKIRQPLADDKSSKDVDDDIPIKASDDDVIVPKIAASVARGPRAKKFGSGVAISLNQSLQGMDSRGKRLSKIFASGVLDMQEEKFSQLNINPTTPYELYLRQLRSNNSSMKQIGVPNENNTRTIEVNTDEIVTADKEVQFSYGDDTLLFNIMRVINERKHKGNTENNLSILAEANIMNSNIKSKTTSTSSTSTRLTSFLQQASQLCERLLDEEVSNRNDFKATRSASNGSSKGCVFAPDNKWIQLGKGVNSGENELIRLRTTVAMKFSTLQPYVLLTVHPPATGDAAAEDLRPNKALYCVWDVTNPGSPSYILESSGIPTCCSFSDTQTYIVVCGTAEGSIYLWDLREDNATHRDRDSIDLGIERGIRKACYSANMTLNSNREVSCDQHVAAILQIESMGSNDGDSVNTSGIMSQFASLDQSGTIVLWVTAAAANSASSTDYGLSPWGSVCLIQTRVLRSHESSLLSAPSTLPTLVNYFSTIPGDLSTFLVTIPEGNIKKVTRFGDVATASVYLKRSTVIQKIASSTKNNEILHDSTVTYMAVRSHTTADKSSTSLILVGRSNGSIDLFQLDIEAPLKTWVLSYYDESSKDVGSIISLKWFPDRSYAFIACDRVGRIQYFDLLKSPNSPLYCDYFPNASLATNCVGISNCRPGSRSVYVVVIGKNNTIITTKLWDELSNTKRENDEIEFNQSMNSWMGRNTQFKFL